MASYSNLSSLFSDIADAIRDKDDTSSLIRASDFPERIAALVPSEPQAYKFLTLTRTYTTHNYPCSAEVYVGYQWFNDGAYEWKWEELTESGSVEIPLAQGSDRDSTFSPSSGRFYYPVCSIRVVSHDNNDDYTGSYFYFVTLESAYYGGSLLVIPEGIDNSNNHPEPFHTTCVGMLPDDLTSTRISVNLELTKRRTEWVNS